jgi:hypothetical protein
MPPPSPAREHVVLLGDSIFDNAAYTGRDPDVITHLRSILPGTWQATLAAIDGATTAGLAAQLRRLPSDATRLVVALGGNDALGHMDLLSLRASSSAEVLDTFAARLAGFERDYRTAVSELARLGHPTTVCTIYNGALPPAQARLARVALMTFNDVILRTAFDLRFDVLELRAVCTEPGDYANPIEPSGAGGRKIAAAIAVSLGASIGLSAPSRVWAHYPA